MNEGKSSSIRWILHEIEQAGFCSNPQIAQELKISLPTAITYSKELLKQGVLVKDGKCPSTGGKRADKLIFNPSYRLSLGLDLRAEGFTLLALDFACRAVKTAVFPLPFADSAAYQEQLAAAAAKFKAALPGAVWQEVLGVSVPGTVSADGTFSSYALKLEQASLAPLAAASGLPLKLINDSNAGALAEAQIHKQGSFVYLNLSRTVGCGIIASGRLLYGLNARAGEVGHVTLFPHGRSCYCGRDGCADPYLNEAALLRADKPSLKAFFAALKEGDAAARGRFKEYLSALALLINNLNNFCDVQIILGGTIGPYLYAYLDELNALIKARALYDVSTLILPPGVPEAPAACGAALLSRRAALDALLRTA